VEAVLKMKLSENRYGNNSKC